MYRKVANWLAILLVVALITVPHFRLTNDMVIGCDLAAYAIIGDELLKGKKLYAETWDHKPPGMHISCAVAEWLCGYGYGELLILHLVPSLLVAWGIYLSVIALGRDRIYGLFAAVVWGGIANLPTFEMVVTNSEVFINTFTTLAFAFWLRSQQKPEASLWRWFGIGLAFGLASMYKQVIVTAIVMLALAHLLVSVRTKRSLYISVLQLAAAVPGSLIPWIATVLWVLWQGTFPEFYDAVFNYNRIYSGSIFSNLKQGFFDFIRPELSNVRGVQLTFLFLLGYALLRWIITRQWDDRIRGWIYWSFFTLGMVFAVYLPGKGFPHYFQLLLPPLIIGLAWFIDDCRFLGFPRSTVKDIQDQKGPEHFGTWVSRLLMLSVLVLELVVMCIWFGRPATAWNQSFGGGCFVESKRVGLTLKNQVRPETRLYVTGGLYNEIYFWGGLNPIVRHFYDLPKYYGLYKDKYYARTLHDLQTNPPDLILSHYDTITPELLREDPVVAWWNDRYQAVDLPELGLKGFHAYVPRNRNPRSILKGSDH